MNELLLFPCGSIVRIKIGGFDGMITCQSLRFDRIQYEITYFMNGEQKVIWAHDSEFETTAEKKKIGF